MLCYFLLKRAWRWLSSGSSSHWLHGLAHRQAGVQEGHDNQPKALRITSIASNSMLFLLWHFFCWSYFVQISSDQGLHQKAKSKNQNRRPVLTKYCHRLSEIGAETSVAAGPT